MMSYDSYMQLGIGLETRQAMQSGIQLQQDLNRLMSDVSINIKRDDIVQANKDVLQLRQNLNAAMNPSRGTLDLSMFQTQMDKSGKSLVNYASSLTKYGKDGQQAFLSLTKAVSSAQAPTTRLSQGLKDAGEQLKRTVGWQLSSSAIHGVMSTYSQAIGYAKELNRSLTDIRIVTGQNQAQMANFAKYANVAAKNLSSTTTRYTDAALIYYQQGLSEKAVKDRTDVTIKMANVAGISAEKASQQLTSIWNNFDNGSKSLEHYADVLVKLGSETASSSDEISKGVQKFAAIGNTVGLSYEYAASALATVTATTRESADTVGTSFRTLFSRLQGLSLGETLEDGTNLNKYSKALDTIGVRIKEANGDIKSMNTILDEVGAKWGNLNKDTQIGLAQTIGGARQYSTFMALMDNWDYFQENVDRANNAAGSLQKQQDIYAEGWQAASNRVKASMEGIFDSIIDDKAIVKMTNGFAGALDIVNGLSTGLGGLGGVLGSVGSIMLSRYSKEIPRVWDDLKYNVAYTFNPKAIYNQQDKVFNDSLAGLDVFRKQAGLDYNEKTGEWFSADGKNIAAVAEFKNQEEQLKRQQQYLRVERTLSQSEKKEYQQRMAEAQMWDNQILAYAQKTQQSYDSLDMVKQSVADESYANIKDMRDNRIKSFQGTKYDFRDDTQAQKYQQAREAAIQREYERRYKNITPAGGDPKKHQKEYSALDAWRRQEKQALNKEVSDFKMKTDSDYKAFQEQMAEAKDYMNFAFSNQSKNESQITPEQFKEALNSFNTTGQIDYGQRQILDKGFKLIQEPLIEAGKSLGNLDGVTGRLTKTINNANTAELKNLTIQEKAKGDSSYTQSLENSWKKFTETATKTGLKMGDVDGANAKLNAADAAYKNLVQALQTGSYTDAQGNLVQGASKEQLAELVKTFQNSYTSAMGEIDRKAWESGLTADQTQDIIAKAKAAGISEDAQKDIEYKKQQEQFNQIQHQTQALEVFAKAGSAAMMTASALQAGANLSQTWNDPNATGIQKATTALGAMGSAGMMAGSLTSLGSSMVTFGAKEGAGVLAKAGGALGGLMANPYVAIATAIATTLGPVLWDLVDSQFENEEEKQERIETEVATAKEDKQNAIQKATNFESASDEYIQSYEKARLSQKGTHEYTSNVTKANEDAYALIEQYGLTSEDYSRDFDTGLIQIDKNKLDEVQTQLDNEATAAQNRSVAMDFLENVQFSDLPQQIEEQKEVTRKAQEKTNYKNVNYQKNVENYEKEKAKLNELSNQFELEKSRNQEQYYDTLTAIASSNESISQNEQYAIQALQGSYNQAEQQAIVDKIEEQYGGDTNKYTLAERKEKAEQVFGEDRYKQLINSEEYKNLQTDEDRNKYLARVTKGEALVQNYQQQIQDTAKLFAGMDESYKNIGSKDSKELKVHLSQLNEEIAGIKKDGVAEDEKARLAQLELAYNYADSYGNRVTNDLVNVISNYTELGARDENGQLTFQDFELKQQENLAKVMQDFGDTFGKDAAESIYRATLNADNATRTNLINSLKAVDLSGSKINSLYNVKGIEKQLGKDFNNIFDSIKKSMGGDSGIFAELTKDDTVKKLVANFKELGDIDAAAIAKAMNSSAELSQAFEVANFNAGGLARTLESVAAGYITEAEATDAFLASMSVLGDGDTVKSDMWNFIDNYDAGRSVTDSTKFFRSVSKTLYTGINQGLYGDDPFQNAWEAMYGKDSLSELNQDLKDWEYNGLNVTDEFKKKYAAEFEEIKKMSSSKTKDNAPIAKKAFEEESLDKDQQYIEGTESTYHSQYTQEDLDWANKVLKGEIKGTDRDKADAQRILDNYKAEDPGTVAIDGAMYDKDEVKFNEEKGQWETGSYDEEGNWQADEKFDEQKALYGYNSRTGQIETPKDFNRSREEMKKDLMANLGMTEVKADAVLADMYTQDANLRALWDGQDRNAIEQKDAEGNVVSRDWSQLGSLGTLVTKSEENGEFITRGQLEAQYAQNENLLREMGYGDMDRWINEVGSSGALGDRYLDFGDLDPQTAKLSELDAALKANTGSDKGIGDRLETDGTYTRYTDEYLEAQKIINNYEDARANGLGLQGFNADDNALIAKYGDMEGLKKYYAEETQNLEKGNVYDLTNAMDQLGAMGLGTDTSYETLTQLMQDQNAILTGGFTDSTGAFKEMTTDSAEYHAWAESRGGLETENAENFANFLSEQQQIEAKIREISIQEEAMRLYQERQAEAAEKTAEATEEANEQAESEETTTEEQTQGAEQRNADLRGEEGVAGSKEESAVTDADYQPPAPEPAAAEEEGGSGGGGGKQQPQAPPTQTVITPRGDGTFVITQEPVPEAAIGKNQSKIDKKYASGKNDNYEGIAQVGELGPELSIDKDGNATILGTAGPTYAYVEKDDTIFTAEETKEILRTNPILNLQKVPGFWGGYNNDNLGGTTYGDIGGSKGNISQLGGSGAEDDEWEADRYVVIMEQLQDLQREYSRLAQAKERAYGADKIKLIDKEIAATKELVKAQQEYVNEIQQYLEKDKEKMKKLGIDIEKEFQFDKNGVIRNFDEIEEKYKKAAEEGDADANKKFQAIQQFMETNNLLQEQADALVDLQWQVLDAELNRITAKVDIKLAVDDTELSYLQYQLGKINEEAYDVAKAINLVGQEMLTTMNKTKSLELGIAESLDLALQGTDISNEEKDKLLTAIMNGTLTEEDLNNLQLDENISQAVMDTVLSYREQLLQINSSLDQLRDQMTQMVDKHFSNFENKMNQQVNVLNAYSKSLNTYYDLVTLLDGKFDGPINSMLDRLNDNLAKQAKNSIKIAEASVKTAETKYMEYMKLYDTAIAANDQDTADKWKKAMEEAYVEVQQANTEFNEALLSANEEFLRLYKEGINRAIEEFEQSSAGLYGSFDNMSAAFERQNSLSEQYIDDYQKYYELNKMARDLQTAIDDTDNINNKKALSKLQDEINKKKNSENKLSEYDIEVLKNKIELEKARLALDEAKNSKSTVTLSRDQNGNWGYIYTAEEDKVAQAEQEYEDKLYQYQEANQNYLNDLQSMIIEAQTNMKNAIADLDPNDPYYEKNRQNIIDAYMKTISYVKQQMDSALGNQNSTLDLSMERYSISSMNLKDSFDELNLSIVTGQVNLDKYFNSLDTAIPKLLNELNNLEKTYDQRVAEVIAPYLQNGQSLSDYLTENIDIVNSKTEESLNNLDSIYNEMLDGLKNVNDEIGNIYNRYITPMNEMIEKNEILAESIQKIQVALSDLTEVELPNIEGTIFENPEGYTENDYGVIRKLTDDENKRLKEIKEIMEVDENGLITNYEDLKNKWYQEEPKEGEEDKRDKEKLAYWDLLEKLIAWKGYKINSSEISNNLTPSAIQAIINSNALMAQSVAANNAIASAVQELNSSFEQTVTITAEFPNVTNSSEIEDAFNSLINDAAQYANRK